MSFGLKLSTLLFAFAFALFYNVNMKTAKVFVWVLIIMFLLVWLVAHIPSNEIQYQRIEAPENFKFVKGSVTKYAWTGEVMANGEYPYEGAVAVSDYKIPLGTKIEVMGKRYVVKDHTAKWIQKKRGFTVDIYSKDSKAQMLAWGRKSANIKIILD